MVRTAEARRHSLGVRYRNPSPSWVEIGSPGLLGPDARIGTADLLIGDRRADWPFRSGLVQQRRPMECGAPARCLRQCGGTAVRQDPRRWQMRISVLAGCFAVLVFGRCAGRSWRGRVPIVDAQQQVSRPLRGSNRPTSSALGKPCWWRPQQFARGGLGLPLAQRRAHVRAEVHFDMAAR